MKKAKQILALMLVVVMVLGMMVFTTGSASAMNVSDYTDADSIEYKEAVDVLTALGVLQGENKIFRPTDTITREEAAKIITYILIGKTSADRLAPRTSSFTDVATSRWSNPYIEYCVEKGIIKGYGDGRFGPADPVTASQMSKMLLMCIGYGGKGEFDRADSWELNSIVNGQKRGILSIDEDFTKPATREQVALYTFNAMTDEEAFLVSYSDLAKDYLPRGSSIFTESSKSFLGAETFNLVEYGTIDSLGYSVREWKLYNTSNANSLTDAYRTDKTITTSSAGSFLTFYMSGAYIGLLDKTAFGYAGDLVGYVDSDDEYHPIEAYVNGVEQDLTSVRADTAKTIRESFEFGNEYYSLNALAGTKGVVVDLVDRNDDGVADKIIYIQKTVSVITSDPLVDAFGTVTLVGVPNNTGGFTHAGNKIAYPGDLKEGNVVLYYKDADGFITVEKAKTITGKMTSYTPYAGMPSMDAINFGGTSYYPTGLLGPNKLAGSPGVNNELELPADRNYFSLWDFAKAGSKAYFNQNATAYLDDGGSIIALVPEGEGELNYLAVVAHSSISLSGMAQARVVLADGSVKNVTISKLTDTITDSTPKAYPVGNGSGENSVDAILTKLIDMEDYGFEIDEEELEMSASVYSYTVDSDGYYALRTVDNNDTIEAGADVVRKAAFSTGFTGNASTVFVVCIPGTTTADRYVSYTGVSNAPVYDGDAKQQSGGHVVMDKNNIAKFVFLVGAPKDTQKNTLLFNDVSKVTEQYTDGKNQYIYTVVDLDSTGGPTKNVTVTEDVHLDIQSYYDSLGSYKSELYEVTADSNGIITGVVPSRISNEGDLAEDVVWQVGITSKPSGGNIKLGGEDTYRYTNDTMIYTIDTTNVFSPVVKTTIASVLASETNLVIGKVTKVNGDPTDIFSELYVIKRDALTLLDGEGLSATTGTAEVGDTLDDAIGALTITAEFDNGDGFDEDTISSSKADLDFYRGQTKIAAGLDYEFVAGDIGTVTVGVYVKGTLTLIGSITITVSAAE